MSEIEKAIRSLETCPIIGRGFCENVLNEICGFCDISESIALALEALQEKLDRENPKPLTLEELRQMDGEPVWVDNFEEWFFVYLSRPYVGDCFVARSGSNLPFSLASKSKAYRNKPSKEDSK